MSYGLIRRLAPAARSSVVQRTMSPGRPLRLADIAPGWAVQDLAGRPLGHVTRVLEDRLTFERGWRRARSVPLGRIAEVRDGVVRLTALASELR